jgi:hypothetical protein
MFWCVTGIFRKAVDLSTIEICDGAFQFCAKVKKIVSKQCLQEENLYKGIRNYLDYKNP